MVDKVQLLTHTPNPRELVYTAFRQCYFDGFAGDMWNDIHYDKIPPETQVALIDKILESGHESPLEHVSFTFALGSVSRALTHQLVRHRIASFSQQSQRYVDASDFLYVIPPSILNNEVALGKYMACMNVIKKTYKELQEILGEGKNEDSRFVLPQGVCSNIVVTMNIRSLANFFSERCCARAQWEIRYVADRMLSECRAVLPEIFDHLGAKCEKKKICPEGSFCCGRFPTN